jgi:hypothetical protein
MAFCCACEVPVPSVIRATDAAAVNHILERIGFLPRAATRERGRIGTRTPCKGSYFAPGQGSAFKQK